MNEPQGDSPTPHLRVAAEVRAHLARQRLSGRQAAFALGWKQPYIARRLSGEIPFDVNDLAAIASLLSLPVSEFFDTRGCSGHREASSEYHVIVTGARAGTVTDL